MWLYPKNTDIGTRSLHAGERERESERGLRVAEYNPRGLGVLNTQVIAVS